MFGHISEVLTVRDFWGKFWHQLVRRVSVIRPYLVLIFNKRPQGFNTFTGYVVDTLHISRGTVWSSQLQIWLSFFLSAIFHAQCHLILPAPGNITLEDRTVPIFFFFLWQAFAISLEDLAHAVSSPLIRRLGLERMKGWAMAKKLIGWMWVLTSFWISIPWVADLTLRFRFGDELMIPFSVVKPLINGLFDALRSKS